MLNLNLNMFDPFRRNRNFITGKVDFTWSRTTETAAGQLAPIVYGTGSIDFVPFAPNTVFFSSSFETGTLGSGSAIGQPVTATITGSGEWPVTGSNTLFINIGSSLGFNQSEVLTLSATADNMNLSGSKISSSFLPELNNEYTIDFGISHTKGNIYNPLVNWIVQNITSVSDVVAINGYTSSFQIVKNENEELVTINEVTASTSDSFDYLFNFGVTASLSANVNNVTGSTTMSFFINNDVPPVVATFFNPTTTIAYATGSFVAITDNPYVISASVEYNKGNTSNSDINYLVSASSTTQDLEGDSSNINGVSSSFELKKDIAVMVSIPEVTGSVSDSYPNDFSFNQTASLVSNVNNTTGSVTMSISIPEAGINVEERFFNPTTATAVLTASFEAAADVSDYNITASIINNKGNESNSDISWYVTGSNSVPEIEATASFRIVKDGNVEKVFVEDIISNSTGSSFKNEYAFNITASLSSSYTPWFSVDSSSFYFGKSIFEVPNFGIDVYSFGTASVLFTSFSAQTNVSEYQITASFEQQETQLIEYVLIGGGGCGSNVQPGQEQNPGSGGGAGALLTGSVRIIKDVEYQVTIGSGSIFYQTEPAIALNGQSSSFFGPLVPYDGTWITNQDVNGFYLIAPGGGGGFAGIAGPGTGSNGGSGAGGAGGGVEPLNGPNTTFTNPGGLAISASAINDTMVAVNVPINQTGTDGGPGLEHPRSAVSGRVYGVGGTGGGKPTTIAWLNPIINSGSVAGGGGGGNQWAQGNYFYSASHGGGSTQSNNGPAPHAIQYTGGGGGGASSTSVTPSQGRAGNGASGSMSIRYDGTDIKATGGIITIGDDYVLHTFLSSSTFTYTG
jgi:hypothetical protein